MWGGSGDLWGESPKDQVKEKFDLYYDI